MDIDASIWKYYACVDKYSNIQPTYLNDQPDIICIKCHFSLIWLLSFSHSTLTLYNIVKTVLNQLSPCQM